MRYCPLLICALLTVPANAAGPTGVAALTDELGTRIADLDSALGLSPVAIAGREPEQALLFAADELPAPAGRIVSLLAVNSSLEAQTASTHLEVAALASEVQSLEASEAQMSQLIRDIGQDLSVTDMFEREMLMNHLSQLSDMLSAVIR